MRTRRYVLFLMLFMITIVLMACNKSSEKSNQGTITPTATLEPTPTTFPLTTLPPTPTPIPAKEKVLADGWFDECRVIDCEDYYFEMLSFKEQNEGGYAIETVFENRQDFTVALAIFDVHINFLNPTPGEGSVDWEEKVIEPGEKKRIEFWIADAYAKRLDISDVSDFNCVQFEFVVDEVDDKGYNNYHMNEIMYYNCVREQVRPYEHVLADDDIVLVDRDDVKLYLTDFIVEDGDCVVVFYLENNSKDILYRRFNCESVNGYECKKGLRYFEETEVEYGRGGYDYFIIPASDIEKSGTTSVTEFTFDVTLYYDAGIWCWEDLIKETFTVYPSEHRAVQEVKRGSFRENIVLFDTDYYKMVYNGLSTEKRQVSETEYTDYYIHVYIENKSAQTLQFVVSDAMINGKGFTNEYNYRSMSQGESKDIKFKWEDAGIAFNGFLYLDSLELSVQIKNMDDEKQSVVFEDKVTVMQ